jgi:hypothetical protein
MVRDCLLRVSAESGLVVVDDYLLVALEVSHGSTPGSYAADKCGPASAGPRQQTLTRSSPATTTGVSDRYQGILASAPGAGALAGAEEQVMTAAELKESHVDIADAARRELAGH